jgi:hypothetical protein
LKENRNSLFTFINKSTMTETNQNVADEIIDAKPREMEIDKANPPVIFLYEEIRTRYADYQASEVIVRHGDRVEFRSYVYAKGYRPVPHRGPVINLKFQNGTVDRMTELLWECGHRGLLSGAANVPGIYERAKAASGGWPMLNIVSPGQQVCP